MYFKEILLKASTEDNFYFILFVLLASINLIYITCNMSCRIFISLCKGLPYLILNKKYSLLLGFTFYNLMLIFVSLNIFVKLYLVIYWYNEILFNILFVFITAISILFLTLYLSYEYENYNFNIYTEVKTGIKEITICLAASSILIVSFFQVDYYKFNIIDILTCKFAGDDVSSGFVDSSTTKYNNNILKNQNTSSSNGQESSSSQGSICSNNTNINNNIVNKQVNILPQTTSVHLTVDPLINIEKEFSNKFENASFWQNILYLNSLEGILPYEELEIKKLKVVNKALASSDFNKISYNMGLTSNIAWKSDHIFKNTLYYPLYNYPVYFNGFHEMAEFDICSYTNITPIYNYTGQINLIRVLNKVREELIDDSEESSLKKNSY